METATLVVSLLVTAVVLGFIWALDKSGKCSQNEIGLLGAFATIVGAMLVSWFFTPTQYELLAKSVKFELRSVPSLKADDRVIFRRQGLEQAILGNLTISGVGMRGLYLYAGNGAGKSTSAEWVLCQIAKNNEHCRIPCDFNQVGEISYCTPENDLPDSMTHLYGKYLVWALNVRSSNAGRLANEVGYTALQVNDIVANYRKLMEKWKVDEFKSVVYVHITLDVPNMSGVGALLDDVRTFCEMLGIRWLVEVSKDYIPKGIPGGVVARSQLLVMPLMSDPETIEYLQTTKKKKLEKTDLSKKYIRAVGGRVGVALNREKVLAEWNKLQDMLTQNIENDQLTAISHFYDKFFRKGNAWDGVSPREIASVNFPSGIPIVLQEFVLNNKEKGEFVFQSRFAKYALDVALEKAMGEKFAAAPPIFSESVFA